MGVEIGGNPTNIKHGGNGEICRFASRLGSKFGTFLCQVLPGDLRGGGEPESLFFFTRETNAGAGYTGNTLRKKKTTCNTSNYAIPQGKWYSNHHFLSISQVIGG